MPKKKKKKSPFQKAQPSCCPSYEKYLEARNIITVTLKNVGLISDISVEKKIMILTKLCNKATSVYG